MKQIHTGNVLKKIGLNLLLFDVGGPSSLVMAGIQANFELWSIFCSIYLIPTLNLRPGLNSVAFFTYIVKFQLSNWSPSWPTLITYEVGETGLDISPHWPSPVTATP